MVSRPKEPCSARWRRAKPGRPGRLIFGALCRRGHPVCVSMLTRPWCVPMRRGLAGRKVSMLRPGDWRSLAVRAASICCRPRATVSCARRPEVGLLPAVDIWSFWERFPHHCVGRKPTVPAGCPLRGSGRPRILSCVRSGRALQGVDRRRGRHSGRMARRDLPHALWESPEKVVRANGEATC